MKTNATILITDISHPVTAGAVESLRRLDFKYYIIGIDSSTNSDQTGHIWVDTYYSIPSPDNPKFIATLLEICQKHKVDILVPWTNEEAIVIAQNAKCFFNIGTEILTSKIEAIDQVVDKISLMNNLKLHNFVVPKYFAVNNVKELKEATKELDYPHKKVVVKPRNLSGERGFCILDTNLDFDKRGFGGRFPLSALLKMLEYVPAEKREKLDYIVMEYLSGEDYSVDVLAKDGKALAIIPRLRLEASEGVSRLGETVLNTHVSKISAEVIRVFGLNFNVNIQMRYAKDRENIPMVYDINPRISGTIALNAEAGINMLHYGIQLAMQNMELPDHLLYKHIKMIRRWKEDYIDLKEQFPANINN